MLILLGLLSAAGMAFAFVDLFPGDDETSDDQQALDEQEAPSDWVPSSGDLMDDPPEQTDNELVAPEAVQNPALQMGSDGDDTLIGTADQDLIEGGAGRDELLGEAGEDTLLGGEGDDMLSGGAGDDEVVGGTGHDALHGRDGNDWLEGGTGGDSLFGGDGNDTLLDGGAESDVLIGGAGADELHFGKGDFVMGGAGADQLMLHLGDDEDVDTEGASPATIADFNANEDMLYLIAPPDLMSGEVSVLPCQDNDFLSEIRLNGDVLATIETAQAPKAEDILLVREA